MSAPKIFLALKNKEYHIKVKGRANFECCPSLRTIVGNFETSSIISVTIDLSECSGMDSCFMGILGMIAVKARQHGFVVNILNAGENNKKLLNGLGLQKLFTYIEKKEDEAEEKQWVEKTRGADRLETAHTVLDAHKTLMELDEDNVKRFKNVVEFVKKDIENEEKKQSDSPSTEQKTN